MSDPAEREGGAGAPPAQSQTAVGAEVRRGLRVAGRHHVELARSDSERKQEAVLRGDLNSMELKKQLNMGLDK